MNAWKKLLIAGLSVASVGCGDGKTSYSLLEETVGGVLESTLDNRIDVLWIIDNSGSMLSSQQNLAANFPSFINQFTAKAYDFQIATNTSDAYLAESPLWTNYYNQNPTPSYYGGQAQSLKAKFRDGNTQHSGFFVLTPSTPDLHDNFVINAMLGTNGRGDERTFDSMHQTLLSQHNSGFVRGGYLAVILLTDEDDFSNDTTTAYESYVPQLTPASYYVSFLDALTNSTGLAKKRYSVNTIAVPNQACLNSIYNGAQKVGNRVRELATATGGTNASICGDFATELEDLASNIVNASLTFSLGNKKPIVSTIVVRINGVVITDWAYDPGTNTISFTNGYRPQQGSSFHVTFDPESLTF